MRTVDGFRVNSSLHAARRALERVPVTRGADLSGASYWLEGVAAKGLAAGRKAVRCPSWCVRDDEDGFQRRAKASQRQGTMRFVWNEEQTAALVVMKKRDEAGPYWLVVTVLSPQPAAV